MIVTQAVLECQVKIINRITNSPMISYTKTDSGCKANVGNYHLDYAYGGVKLVQICTDGGGITEISRNGYGTKRELYYWMDAFITGLGVEL